MPMLTGVYKFQEPFACKVYVDEGRMLHVGALVVPMFTVQRIEQAHGGMRLKIQALELNFGEPTTIVLRAKAFLGGDNAKLANKCVEELKGLMDLQPLGFEYSEPTMEERREYKGWVIVYKELTLSLLIFVWHWSRGTMLHGRKGVIAWTLMLMVCNGAFGWPGVMIWRVPIANLLLSRNLLEVGCAKWFGWTAYVGSLLAYAWLFGVFVYWLFH